MSGRGDESGKGKKTGRGNKTGKGDKPGRGNNSGRGNQSGHGLKTFKCQFCPKSLLGKNLKRHIWHYHKNFLQFRANKYNCDIKKARDNTYHNHVKQDSLWPPNLLYEFNQLKEKGTLNKFMKNKNDEDVDMESKDEISDEENYMENLKENEELAKKSIDLKQSVPNDNEIAIEIDTNIDRIIPVKIDNQNQPKNIEITSQIDANIDNEVIQDDKVSANNIASTEKFKIHEVQGEDFPIRNASKRKTQTLLAPLPRECRTCVRMDTLYEFAQEQLIKAVNDCSESVLSCSCNKQNEECCCKEKLKTILEKVENVENVSGKEDESEEYIKQDKDSELIENFFFKYQITNKIKNKLWFCSVCVDFNKTIGKRKEGKVKGDWHFKGIFDKKKKSLLVDGMRKHLDSDTHNKCKEKAMKEMGGKSFSVLSNEMAEKTTQNLCIASQFSATHNLTQRFHPKMCHFLHTLNENLGSNIKAKVHPLGNVHHTTMAIKGGMKACYLATQERIKEEDQKIFPPTNMLQRYALCYDKGTAVKDSQRQAIVATKIDYKSGLPSEILVAASVVPQGTAVGVLDHITAETEKLLDTKNIAFTCSDNEPVYAGKISGVGERMSHHDKYSPKVIHLEDTSHNAEKVATPPQKKYEKQLEEEAWVFETIATAKSLIGNVLTHPKMTKILRKYSDDCVEDNVRFYVFQPIMNVRYSEYMSRSLSSILKNLNIMITVLPDIASEDSMHDHETKKVATELLEKIQDPVFIARVYLLDKVFFHISVLEKDAQSVTFSPFDYVRVKENLRKELEQLKHLDVKDIETIVEKGELEIQYNFRKKKQIDHINLNDIKLPERELRSSTIIKGKEVFDKFLKWIDHLLIRCEDYLKVPECMRLALEIFSITDELTDENLDEKLVNLKHFFPIVNTEYEKCGENCLDIKCKCLKDQLNRFLSSVSERMKKIDEANRKKKTKKKSIDYSEFYSFYFCEKNIETVKELKITNILRALELTILMKASQASTERVVSQIKKTVKNRFENVARWAKVIDFDMVNINVFLRWNSSIDKMNSELASKKYTEALNYRPSMKKTKPYSDISLTLQRLLKKNSETLKSKKEKPKMKPVSLVSSSSWEKNSKTSKTDVNQGTTNTNENSNRENPETHTSKIDPDIENKEINITESTPSTICIDDCHDPEESTFKWIGCKNSKDKCKSYLKRRNEGHAYGDWFHSSCIGLGSLKGKTKKAIKKITYLCPLCKEADPQSKSNIQISDTSSTPPVKVKMQSKLNFSQQDRKDMSNIKKIDAHPKSKFKPDSSKTMVKTNTSPKANLVRELEQESRKIVWVKGNGDCLFSSISVCRIGKTDDHKNIRILFCDTLENMFYKHRKRWTWITMPMGDELKDPELYFVSKVMHQCLDDEHIFNKKNQNELTEEDLKKYLMNRRTPCEESDSRNKNNWGNALDIHLICLVYKVNVYYINETISDYRLMFWSQYESLEFVPFEENRKREYVILLYEYSGSHYSPIITNDPDQETPIPICCTNYPSRINNCHHKKVMNVSEQSSKRLLTLEASVDEKPSKSIKLEPEDSKRLLTLEPSVDEKPTKSIKLEPEDN